MDTKEIIFGPKPQPAKDFHAKVSANFRLSARLSNHFNRYLAISPEIPRIAQKSQLM
jgi:hypothetical protein